MDLFRKKSSRFPVIFSLIGVLFLAVTTLYLSGTLQSITTTILKPKAASLTPKIDKRFQDNFKASSINLDKWQVSALSGIKITQTSEDNLRFYISEGSASGRRKDGQLLLKQLLKSQDDFAVTVVVYRPIVTGTGRGTAGMRFSSTGSGNDESATVEWLVSGSTSEVQFTVRGADGRVKINKSQDLVSTIAILRLVRVNGEYKAIYKVGNDFTSDTAWKLLGICNSTNNCNAELGADGRVALFAHNGGTTGSFPKVVARFDTALIGWEDITVTPSPATTDVFTDAFSGGGLGNKWVPSQTAGVTMSENAKDNLLINIPGNSTASGRLRRTTPVVGIEKNFTYEASLFKPSVWTDGAGYASIAFVSTSAADKEGAGVRWVVTKNGTTTTSKLAFYTRDRVGAMVESGAVAVTGSKYTIRLQRRDNKYSAWYRKAGDSDAAWKRIGDAAAEDTLGADGSFYIGATNVGYRSNPPRVVAQFDSVSGWIEK